jgi:hypothetical protein
LTIKRRSTVSDQAWQPGQCFGNLASISGSLNYGKLYIGRPWYACQVSETLTRLSRLIWQWFKGFDYLLIESKLSTNWTQPWPFLMKIVLRTSPACLKSNKNIFNLRFEILVQSTMWQSYKISNSSLMLQTNKLNVCPWQWNSLSSLNTKISL